MDGCSYKWDFHGEGNSGATHARPQTPGGIVRRRIEDVQWIRLRSTRNRPANWNSPPNKSPCSVSACSGTRELPFPSRGIHPTEWRVSFGARSVSSGKRTLPRASVEPTTAPRNDRADNESACKHISDSSDSETGRIDPGDR